MADKEYGSKFKIVQLFNGGIKIITNELSLGILKVVMRKQSNITEISKILKSSKTTVQANILSMESEGILVSRPDPHDNRSVIYGSNCIPILSSGVDSKTKDGPRVDILKRRKGEIQNPHRNAMILFSNELCRHNICIHPMLLDIGSSLGSEIIKSLEMDGSELISLFSKVFMVDEGYFKDISLGDTLSVRMGAEGITITDLSFMGYVVMGVLMYYRYMQTRDIYSREVRLVKVSPSEFILETEKLFVKEIDNEVKPVGERDWKFYRPLDEYSIYHPDDGVPLVITNETMNLILEKLEESGEKTVNSLSTLLGMKTITVHASIVKMMKLGLVEQVDPNEVRNIRYRLSAHTLMVAKKDYAQFVPGTIQDILDRFIRKEADLFETIYSIQFFLYACAGIRHDYLISSIATTIAEYYVGENQDMSAEQFLKDAISLYIDCRNDLKLVSVLPVRYTLECNDEGGMVFRDSKIFMESLVQTGLRILTGMQYPVVVDFVQKES